jgi:methyl-accepting chemotaxis protein
VSEPSRGWKGMDLLGRMRIGPRLLLAPGLVLLLLVVASSGAWWALVRQNQSLESIVEVRAARIRQATELATDAQSAHARVYQLLTWISGSFSQRRIGTLVADIHQRHATIDRKFIDLVAQTEAGSAERRFLEQSQAAHALYVTAVGEVIELSLVDQSIGANAMIKAERAFDIVALRLIELSRLERQLSETASQRAARDFRAISTVMPLLVALSVVLSLAITVAVRRSFLRQVRGIGEAALDLASGNLTVPRRDYGSDEISETSRALDTSIRTLNSTLRGILDSARSIDTASREIALGNVDLSNRTEEQASSLEQTSASMLALSATVSRTASTALEANRLAANASSIAQKGGGVVDQLVRTLAAIKISSQRVLEIVGAIDAIASQTGTLALNAAVEAARAGEQGRGFVTVVGEMRMLAQQASGALGEIRELVAHSMAQIDGGSAAAEEAGYSLADIVSSVRRVGDMIDSISDASAAQASGISHVNSAIVEMDQMSQQNSVLVEQAAAAAETLQHQAVTLSRAVASFKLDENAAVVPCKPGKPHLRLASKRG